MGSGPDERYLRKLASGVDGVVFIGQVDSPATKKLLYGSCMAVVVPSYHETLPTVILEAMACSKPVIATNVGGNSFMIKHGKNGFLVEPADLQSIANFIILLHENSSLNKNLGSFGRKLVEEEFTVEKTVDRTARVYESML